MAILFICAIVLALFVVLAGFQAFIFTAIMAQGYVEILGEGTWVKLVEFSLASVIFTISMRI